MDSFDFYREARQNYRHIVPSKEDGLILFYLFEKWERGDFHGDEFAEPDIIEAIEYVYADVKGENSKRNEYERNNDTILRLQEFFIWRDERKKKYTFKSYGIGFCQNIRDQLKQYYSPTEIKAIFDSLIQELLRSKDNESRFMEWVHIHFNERSPNLSRQIEVLDQQVGDAVKTFRSRILAEEQEINKIIADALDSLKSIKQNSDEFRNAFHGTYEIEECLLDIQEKLIVSDDMALKIRKIRDFIKRTRTNLELVSKRIDQIQPRLREFIHDFNQRDFDRKTEIFLKLFLKATLDKQAAPAGCEPRIIREKVPVFTIVLKRPLGISKPVEILTRTIDLEKREKSLESIIRKRKVRERVQYWMAELNSKIMEQPEIDFSKIFFEIIDTEKEYALTIAVKFSHQVILKFSSQSKIQVTVQKQIEKSRNKNIGIWKMTIKQKSQQVILS